MTKVRWVMRDQHGSWVLNGSRAMTPGGLRICACSGLCIILQGWSILAWVYLLNYPCLVDGTTSRGIMMQAKCAIVNLSAIKKNLSFVQPLRSLHRTCWTALNSKCSMPFPRLLGKRNKGKEKKTLEAYSTSWWLFHCQKESWENSESSLKEKEKKLKRKIQYPPALPVGILVKDYLMRVVYIKYRD